jgi:hypothetical protein
LLLRGRRCPRIVEAPALRLYDGGGTTGGRSMRKLSTVLRLHAFHLLLLFVALIVFCKPVLLTLGNERPGRVMVEFFLPWAWIVFVLYLVGNSGDESSTPSDQSGETERD